MIQIGDVVRIRAGRTNWTVIDVVGDRAYMESSSAYTDPPALLSDLTVVTPESETNP